MLAAEVLTQRGQIVLHLDRVLTQKVFLQLLVVLPMQKEVLVMRRETHLMLKVRIQIQKDSIHT
jgi:hypothetical protein